VSANTKIEWAHDTFSPWWGCQKVSPACANCYAEGVAARFQPGHWGPGSKRRMASESYWRKPEAWNRQAAAAGERRRVFCASMADVFEDRPDLDGPRFRLFNLISLTPYLDWLLLTKRPDRMLVWANTLEHADETGLLAPEGPLVNRGWPSNAWAGVTVENQATADERIPLLLQVPAPVRFLSMEPLLGPVDLSIYLLHRCSVCTWRGSADMTRGDEYRCPVCDGEVYVPWDFHGNTGNEPGVHWVIAGGESGPRARPSHPDWFRSIRDQCQRAEVPFHFKQWGAWSNLGPETAPDCCVSLAGQRVDAPWGRERFPSGSSSADRWNRMYRVGKKAAGRVLDGRTWDEVP